MVESAGDPNARNPADPSAGLMQVTPLIGRAYGPLTGPDDTVLEALLDPETNIRAGTGWLNHLRSRYGKKHLVETWVIAYNSGEPNFDKGFRNDYGKKFQRALEVLNPWI